MGHQIKRVRGILNRWSGAGSDISVPELEIDRRTAPDARMNMVLRFSTESGPRTIVASGVTLNIAAAIAREMEKAGHFAQLVDHMPPIPMAERIKKRKSEKQSAAKRKMPTLSVVRVRNEPDLSVTAGEVADPKKVGA